MSVRQGILALLSEQQMYGAQLRSEFEERTGGTWPLNVGQVYSTLNRLERDGMVEKGDIDEEGRISYRITRAGRTEVRRWWTAPVERDATPPRGELVIKLALAVTVPGVDVLSVVHTQRAASIGHLQDLTRLKRDAPTRPADGAAGPDPDLAWSLVLDNLIFAAEAELRWLDHVEGRLKREAQRRPKRRTDHSPAWSEEQDHPAVASDPATSPRASRS